MCVYRSPVAKFLLEGGQTQSWLLGNSIISVTTSGGARVGKSGLCEKCLRVARTVTGHEPSSTSGQNEALRRRHKSEAVRTCRGEDGSVAVLKPLLTHSQDDIGLHRRPVCAASLREPSDSAPDDVELMRLDAKKKAMDDVLISMPFCSFIRLTLRQSRPDKTGLKCPSVNLSVCSSVCTYVRPFVHIMFLPFQ